MDTLLEQATPRPWKVVVRAVGTRTWPKPEGPAWSTFVVAGDHEYHIPDGTPGFAPDAAPDAELIVRAVNAYEPLVKALRELLDALTTYQLNSVMSEQLFEELMQAAARARAALVTVESSPEREGGE